MKNKFSSKELFRFISRYIENWSLWFGILILICFYVAFGRLLPILFGRSVDQGIIPQDISAFKNICISFLIIGVLRALTGFILHYIVRKESNWISYKVRRHLHNYVLKLKISYFDKNPSGKILTRVANDTKSFQTLLGDGIIGIVINIFELLSILIALMLQSFTLSLIVLISFPATVWIGTKLAKKIQTEYFVMKDVLSTINTYLADSLNGFTIIKSYGYFDNKYQHFKNLSEDYFEKQVKISKIYALLWPQLDLFQLLSSVLCFGIGSVLVQKNQLEIGSLIAFTLLIQGFFHPLRYILESLNHVQNGLTSSKRIDQILQEPKEVDSGQSHLQQGFKPSISIKNIDFSYVDGKYIFNKYNLEIKAFSVTALIGRTGSGKTTLASMLQKLYTPESGEILISGVNVDRIANDSLRKELCVVRQEDFIFQGSLAENIALSQESSVDLKRAKDALEFSGIDKALDFKLSTSGGNLSPGERQLLSFARIHYLAPKILIFDEATSFIDEETEAQIQRKAKKLFKDKTVVIIAHKQTTIDMCDEIVSL